MKRRPKGKHTEIVDYVEQRLKNSSTLYDIIIKEQDYDDPVTHKHGECDVHAVSDKYLLCFEVKSYDNIKREAHACYQLDKDEHYYKQVYPNVERVFKIYVSGKHRAEGVNIKWES